jgi:hypothetical protein
MLTTSTAASHADIGGRATANAIATATMEPSSVSQHTPRTSYTLQGPPTPRTAAAITLGRRNSRRSPDLVSRIGTFQSKCPATYLSLRSRVISGIAHETTFRDLPPGLRCKQIHGALRRSEIVDVGPRLRLWIHGECNDTLFEWHLCKVFESVSYGSGVRLRRQT